MQFKEIKKLVPKKIRNHLYSRYSIEPETKIAELNKPITASSFAFSTGFTIRYRLLIFAENDGNARVIYRPARQKVGSYFVTYMADERLYQTRVDQVSEIRSSMKHARVFVMEVYARKSYRYLDLDETDMLALDKADTTNQIKCFCDYWDTIAANHARAYIQKAKETIVSMILELDPDRSENGKITTYGRRGQREIALDQINMLERLQRNPYSPDFDMQRGDTKTSARHYIGLYPYDTANQSVSKIKKMLNRNVLAKLQE